MQSGFKKLQLLFRHTDNGAASQADHTVILKPDQHELAIAWLGTIDHWSSSSGAMDRPSSSLGIAVSRPDGAVTSQVVCLHAGKILKDRSAPQQHRFHPAGVDGWSRQPWPGCHHWRDQSH